MNKMSNIAGALVLLIVFSGVSLADTYPGIGLDRLTFRAIRTLHSAEVTYYALDGNNYGSLSALGAAGLIDPVLATGNKYGHVFVVSLTPSTPTSPAAFSVTATPRAYRKAGRWSFFIDQRGQVHGADKRGEPATEADPVISACMPDSIVENERCTVLNMRTLYSAEVTYFALFGNYTGLAELASTGLIGASLASGQLNGYSISVVTFSSTTSKISVVPQSYGATGIRSFFVDETGVIRAADHQGGPANENDPPI